MIDEALLKALHDAVGAARACAEAHDDDCGCPICEAAAGMLWTIEGYLSAVDSALVRTEAVILVFQDEMAHAR